MPKKAYLDYVPKNGFYKYKTSPNQFEEWIMAGEIFINKILTDKEVGEILLDKGISPMPRQNGDINLEKYGF